MSEEKLSGAELVVRSLEYMNISTIFGLPGGAILPAYDPLYDSPIRHILARHEQGSGHMAEGYAQATGELGVVIATSGPGATNLITPLTNALMDSTPLLAITGQVASEAIGNDAFQEAYTVGLTMAATKHNYLITSAEEIPQVLLEAKHIATTGRPGPVLVDIPKDILNQKVEWIEPKLIEMPGYKPTLEPNPKMISQAAELIKQSKKPILYVGGGIIHSKANQELFELATKFKIPVVTTLMGRGAFPDGNELCFEMPGMHGNYTATTSIQKSDLLIAIGVRFDDRVTGDVNRYAKQAKIIHFEIDPAEVNKNIEVDIAVLGDAKQTLSKILRITKKNSHKKWHQKFKDLYEIEYQKVIHNDLNPIKDGLTMGEVMKEINIQTKGDAAIVSDVGQHQMIACRYSNFNKTKSNITSGGLGTMGFALPAAIGAKMACPEREVVAVIGDGGYQITIQELGTVFQTKAAVKIVVLNNDFLGMVRQWQQLFFDKRYASTEMLNPDFVKIAEGYYLKARRVAKREDLANAVEEMIKSKEPYFLEVVVEKEANVFPMIPTGCSVSEIRLS